MVFSVHDDNIFRFFREVNVFSIENFKFCFKSWTLHRMSRRGNTLVKLVKLTLVVRG